MRDRKLKLLPASIYEAAATETWLADQAKRGWRPVRIGPQAAKMERSAPAECQYRLEPIDSAALIRDEALRDYYTEAGWEFVCFSANRDFRVWRSTRPDPVEIHGDPQVEAGAYRGLARRLYRDCALSVCHTLLWLFLIWPRSTALAGRLEGLAFAAPGTGALLATLIYLYFLAWTVSGAGAVYRLRRRLKQGIPLDHTRRYGHLWSRVRAAALGLSVLLVLLSVCWRPSWQPLRPDISPVLPAAELGAGEGGEAYLWQGGNLLAGPVMRGIERGKGEVILDTKYAALRLPFLAKPLLAEMTEWWDPAGRVTLEDSRFDEAYYMAGPEWQQLALRRGGQVLYVAAKVPDDLRDHISEYAAALAERR